MARFRYKHPIFSKIATAATPHNVWPVCNDLVLNRHQNIIWKLADLLLVYNLKKLSSLAITQILPLQLLRHMADTVVSNHWQLFCSSNSLLKLITRKTQELHITGHLWGEPSGLQWLPSRPVIQTAFPYHDVIMLYRTCSCYAIMSFQAAHCPWIQFEICNCPRPLTSPIQIWPSCCFYVPSAARPRSERKSNKRVRFESD